MDENNDSTLGRSRGVSSTLDPKTQSPVVFGVQQTNFIKSTVDIVWHKRAERKFTLDVKRNLIFTLS